MPTAPVRKTRVMVDATVLIAGSGWPRWPREVLLAGLRGEFQLVLSPYVIRQAHRNLSERFPAEHLERFEELLSQANYDLIPDPTSEEVAQHNDLVRDQSDIPIALAASTKGVSLSFKNSALTNLAVVVQPSNPITRTMFHILPPKTATKTKARKSIGIT